MKKVLVLILICGMVLGGLPAYAADSGTDNTTVLHVSPNGSDTNPGTEDRPLATLDAARRIVRGMAKKEPIEVLFHAGEYRVSQTVWFDSGDAGTEQAPITYKSAGDGEVIFNGAKILDISAFEPVTDQKILKRLPASAVGRVGQMDLGAQGITQDQIISIHTQWNQNPYEQFCTPQIRNIYVNGREQQLARWPNKNFLSISNVVSDNTFVYTETNPSNWTEAKDVFIAGYMFSEWEGGWAQIERIDPANRTITLKNSSVLANHRWSAVNLLEEMDIPGEWYADRETMTLYYYPEKLLEPGRDIMELPVLRDAFIGMTQCPYVNFEGLTFERGYCDGIRSYNSDHVIVRNCVMRDLAGAGIYSDNGRYALFEDNTIYNTGMHNIYYNFTDSQSDKDNIVHTGTVISNNHCYNGANHGIGMSAANISFSGIGTVVENNTVHRGINSGIIGTGPECVVRYNEIYNMVRESADAGAYYMGRTWTNYGTDFSYNYIHDLGDREFDAANLVDCVFWDDAASGQTARYNIMWPNSKTRTYGVISGGGRDNDISYNIIVDSDQSIGMQDRTTYLTDVKTGYFDGVAYKGLEAAVATSTPYNRKYPQMLKTYQELEQTGIFYPNNNTLMHNVIINSADINYANAVKDLPTTKAEGNYVGTGYDIFVDPENQDFRIKKSAKAELGLDDGVLDEDFDITQIGMQREMIDVDRSFAKTYPRNGDSGLNAANVTLSWQQSAFADEYVYEVATDPDFNNIVRTGTTIYTNTEIENLEKDTNYYWRVKAKTISRAFPSETESEDVPFLFKTAAYDILVTDNLKSAVEKAELFAESITEGEELGQYKPGTKDALNTAIASADAILKMTSGQQATINNAELDLNAALEQAKSSINVGYMGTIDTSPESEWVTQQPDHIQITREDGGVTVTRASTEGMAASGVEYPSYGIYQFQIKASLGDGWCAVGMRHSNINSHQIYYSEDNKLNNYFIIIKKDAFELQSRNSDNVGATVMVSAPNNGIFKENEWNDIEMGMIPAGKGNLCLVKINGQEVFTYLDEANPVRAEGRISLQPADGSWISIRSAENAKTGPYTPPEELLQSDEGLPIYYTTESPEYTESGTWAVDDQKGYQDMAARSTKEAGAYAQFSLKPADEIRTYRVSYYHVPGEDNDPAASVYFRNLYTSYTRKLDLTQGEAGWVELGIFNFANEAAKGVMDIQFTASGQGTMRISALKIEQVEESMREFSEVFTLHAKNALLLKASDNRAFKDISEYTLDATPTILNGRTLIPLRFVSEAFDAQVDWRPETRTATIQAGDKQIVFQADSLTYTDGGNTMTLDQPPVIQEDRMMVPLRALAEALGNQVMWDDRYQLILIAKEFQFEEQNKEKIFDVCNAAFTQTENGGANET